MKETDEINQSCLIDRLSQMDSAEKTYRKIIHVDMDALYAAVEQRDQPGLLGTPVIVGGEPNSRGVVATCSYEARAFGVSSAMPSSQAMRLCPEASFVPPRFEAYRQVSAEIRDIFSNVEQFNCKMTENQ